MSDLKKLNLLLVGRTGNGKSSTGNSILNKNASSIPAFKASMNSEPFTEEDIKHATTTHGQLQITVVDGPGIGDANLSDPGEVDATIALTKQAVAYCPGGFNAVLLVLKYGERFTKQEKDAVDMVKAILGSHVLARHGVVVMTRGDNFDIDKEEDGVSFNDWCRQQTGEVAKLFQECKQRIALFNNRIKEGTEFDAQREDLLGQIARCQSDPYTLQDYNDAQADRHRLKVSSNFGIMEDENQKFVNKINAAINRLDISRSPDDAIKTLTSLELELDRYKLELDAKISGTDVGKSLLGELKVVGMTLTTKRQLAEVYQKQEQEYKHGSTKHGQSTSYQRLEDTRKHDSREQTGRTEPIKAWPPTNEHSQTSRNRTVSSPRPYQEQQTGYQDNKRGKGAKPKRSIFTKCLGR